MVASRPTFRWHRACSKVRELWRRSCTQGIGTSRWHRACSTAPGPGPWWNNRETSTPTPTALLCQSKCPPKTGLGTKQNRARNRGSGAAETAACACRSRCPKTVADGVSEQRVDREWRTIVYRRSRGWRHSLTVSLAGNVDCRLGAPRRRWSRGMPQLKPGVYFRCAEYATGRL